MRGETETGESLSGATTENEVAWSTPSEFQTAFIPPCYRVLLASLQVP